MSHATTIQTVLTKDDYVLTPLGIRRVGKIIKNKDGQPVIRKKYRWDENDEVSVAIEDVYKCDAVGNIPVFIQKDDFEFLSHKTECEDDICVAFNRVMHNQDVKQHDFDYIDDYTENENKTYLLHRDDLLALACNEEPDGAVFPDKDKRDQYVFKHGSQADILQRLSHFGKQLQNDWFIFEGASWKTVRLLQSAMALHFGILISYTRLDKSGYRISVLPKFRTMFNRIVVAQRPFNNNFADNSRRYISVEPFNITEQTETKVFTLPDSYRSIFERETDE